VRRGRERRTARPLQGGERVCSGRERRAIGPGSLRVSRVISAGTVISLSRARAREAEQVDTRDLAPWI
jgi:hypothetical protein